MPLSTEVVANRPLGGRELIECVINDLRERLEKDGLFAPYVAYRQIRYTISVRFNLNGPEHLVNVPPRGDEIRNPDVDVTIERDREITSPNAARVLNDLPITTAVHLGEGRNEERIVQYDKESVPPQPPPVDRVIGTVPDEIKGKSPKVVKPKSL